MNRAPVLLAALALILAACGGTDDTAVEETTTTTAAPTTAPDEPTSTTTEATTTTAAPETTTTTTGGVELESLMTSLDASGEMRSARIEGSIEMTGLDEEASGLSEIAILFSSAFNEAGDSSFLMDMSSMAEAMEADPDDPFAGMAAAFLGEIEFRQIGDRAYIKFPFFTSMLGAETDWISMAEEDGGEFTSGMETVPQDPFEVMDAYGGAEATIEELGVENINGIDATHYRISLDAEKMDLTAEERAELEASGLFAGGIIPMDIWISEEGFMVRMLMEIDGSQVDAPPEEQFDTMRIRYDVYDINGDVVIEPPPASEVTDAEDLEGFTGFGFDG